MIRSRTYSINKNHIGFGMIILGILYFFSRTMAPDSPILTFFTNYSSIAFGNIGLLFFF